MRPAFTIACLIALAGTVVPASAENRTFVIANNADGYGIDRCLATGASCGHVVATAYCQSQAFAQAQAFHKVASDEPAGSLSTSSAAACRANCDNFIAIECTR